MKRQRQRLISILSVLAFLIANTPGSAVAVRCPWVVLPARHSVAYSSPHSVVGEHDCDCCHKQDDPARQADQTAHPPKTPDCPTCPSCPEAPSCPFGCCWCSVAKVPCFLDSLALSTDPLPTLGARLVEISLQLPPAHGTELIRPPRA